MGLNHKEVSYPNFPEYKLLDLYPIEKIHYKRGNDYKDLFSEEYSIWQNYFCEEYIPPKEKNIVLFHTCSWSKPYDFSFIIKPIRDIANKFQNIHRIILSNVGVVPYEYQMNPTFCSYDYQPRIRLENKTGEEVARIRGEYLEVHYNRIFRYISSHINDYKKVIIFGIPVKYTGSHFIAVVCKELNIPYENVISKELYLKYKNQKYEDSGEIFIEPEILKQLECVLERNCLNR